ncbi:helix-turn-helix domain-containing protein [Gimesia fumaroli]|uniref:Helix-turn-helix domain-containing protein n=1 Tax=Gimesia fumaroli TaxID=2527976 RepID=A0A518I8Z8_9PLAN|nr:helix-turn-helix domain-containing protein [Gimesia fumaroli]QDV49586.1 hypothetical protein Enr17x_16060 [Gimesia fumaroli]
MPKHKPSARQKHLDFEKLEVNRILKIELLEKLQADYRIKNLLFAIDRHLRNNRDCWPSYAGLAEQIGASVRSVGRHIQMACEQGWLLRESGGKGKNNHYRINWSMVFDAVPITTQDMAAARLKAESGVDADKELDRKQEQRRAANLERRQSQTERPKRRQPVDGFPRGYCPSGLPLEKKKPANKITQDFGIAKTTKRKGKRWNCHVDPEMLRNPEEIDSLFKRAVDLGFAKNTDPARLIVWSIAVHCRSADNPGALFRHKIETGDIQVSMPEEDKALKEMEEHDKQSNVFNKILDEAFEGVT